MEKDSIFLTISATDEDPQRAADMANAVGESINTIITAQDFGDSRTYSLSPVVLTVMQKALAPTTPSSSNRATLLIGFLASCIVACIAAVIREVAERKVHRAETVTAILDAPLLASIEESKSLSGKPVVMVDPQSHVAEDIRRLALNLTFVAPDKTSLSNVFVISSAGPAEGKTTIAANMAAAIAERGESVLVIDTDLRKPRMASLLGINGHIGLTHVLTQHADSLQAVHSYWKENFHVLPAGNQTTNPSMIINSQAMEELLRTAARNYDYVILDTAPLSVTNDAAVFANLGALLLMVTTRGKTYKRQLKNAANELQLLNIQAVGSVFNRAPHKTRRSQNYYYYGHGERKYSRKRKEEKGSANA